MVHSFHHIEDPIKTKEDFLKNCFSAMTDGSWLCIAETFVPTSVHSPDFVAGTRRLWEQRVREARASTFWNALRGLDEDCLADSRDVSEFASSCEAEVGRLVEKRAYEYSLSLVDLTSLGSSAGFRAVLVEPVNSVGDAVVLFSR